MKWSKDGESRGYHHGNLKEALVAAALELINQKGLAGFTFADAARLAGVSAAAPYRHFRDRDELLAGVALRGFNLLEASLVAALDARRVDPSSVFENVATAYLDFARAQPAFYAAMFEAGIALKRDTELRQASDRVFSVLRQASDRFIAGLPQKSRPPALMVGLHMWALLHGTASLFGRGDDAKRSLPMSPQDLLEAAILIYRAGLQGSDPSKS